jgi:hypothetical protein
MEAVLQRVKSITDEASVPLLLLIIPHPIDVCDSYDTGRVDTDRFPEYDRRNLTAPLEIWARSSGAHAISLFDEYQARGACELYYRAGNDHWNAAGQALAAELVVDYVLTKIPVGNGPGKRAE